jgi:hypothetical protein
MELHLCQEGIVINKDATGSDIMRWDFGILGAKSVYSLNACTLLKNDNIIYPLKNSRSIFFNVDFPLVDLK